MRQSLGAGWPFAIAGENVQPCAAFSARFAKYLLGPGASSEASLTFPAASAESFTLTFTVPLIVSLALCETLGRTWWRTSARAISAAGFTVGAGLVAAAGASVLAATRVGSSEILGGAALVSTLCDAGSGFGFTVSLAGSAAGAGAGSAGMFASCLTSLAMPKISASATATPMASVWSPDFDGRICVLATGVISCKRGG